MRPVDASGRPTSARPGEAPALVRRVLEPAEVTPLRVTFAAIAVASLALAGLGGCAAEPAEVVEDGDAAQSAAVEDELGTIEGDPASGRAIAVLGATRVVVEGDRVRELERGRRYALELARTSKTAEDGMQVRALLGFRKVLALVGTIADAPEPGAVVLRSVRGASYVLVGDTVLTYQDIRAALPAHDYGGTYFRVEAVRERAPSTRWSWLGYEPVPRYHCAEDAAPEVQLDLVNVKPDDSVLDGFVATRIGHEARMGPHAECARDGAGYACALDTLGEPWGSARFVPDSAAPFSLVVRRNDIGETRQPFTCTTITRASLEALSEG